ncbi:MAG: amidohydrolase family protein [Gammaproteobacteria bacterium]|nr:amidohydrolase family protein [Gammaproteobacteria bacterium]
MFDLLIKNGLIVDGKGKEPFRGDVAIRDGTIVEVGKIIERAHNEIEASNFQVTPGFVDIHTHYDGQVTWGEELTPSSNHGVTTAVMGNCGVGFAPCRPTDKERLISLMEGVEDIPHPVLSEGLPWNWETFPEYLDSLSKRKFDIDFAAQIPHGPLRVYVMGDRGANREPATKEDINTMAALTSEAISAGALGFSTSRTLNHQTADGQPTPTLTAELDELVGIAKGVQAAGSGVMQVVTDFKGSEGEFEILKEMVKQSNRPLSVSVAQHHRVTDGWRNILNTIEEANKEGIDLKAQVCGRPVGVLFGLELTNNPFSAHPSFQSIEHLTLKEKLKKLKDPAFKEKLLSEKPQLENNPFLRQVHSRYHDMYAFEDEPNYEPLPSTSIAALAEKRGIHPLMLCLEILTQDDGKNMIYYTFLNYGEGTLEPAKKMMEHPNTILGLGDGGAHCGSICDGSFTTHMLTHWVRDRTRGEKLTLQWVIKAHCQDTARAVGLYDRGIIAPGYKADINVIDLKNMKLHKPEVHYDLPAAGRRLMQYAEGYVATIVNGEIIYLDGKPTGARPGKLVRGSQRAPLN